MSLEILQNSSEIERARAQLVARKISFLRPWWGAWLARSGLLRAQPAIGDHQKSWDVLKTADFLADSVVRNAPVLDVGAYASEIVCVLQKIGYRRLFGLDLNPEIGRMPFANAVRYLIGDFYHTPFRSESFQAITAISVVEHGLHRQALLAEMSRLLRPGGYFIASFDYWPDKVDTAGTEMFGMEWSILSQDEVLGLIEEARAHRFVPCGAIESTAAEKTIHYADRDYTFGWLALRKTL